MIAAVLSLGTFATQASACQGHNHEQVMSCAEGTSYDADTKACVPQTTG
jgi:uncharacterized protein YfaQ (DUF2300 family)